jgi:hypothetical protein
MCDENPPRSPYQDPKRWATAIVQERWGGADVQNVLLDVLRLDIAMEKPLRMVVFHPNYELLGDE